MQEVTNIFLNDRPTEELCTRAKTTTTQDNDPATEHTSEEEGEDNDKDREMAGTHTILINPDEIPDGDEFIDEEDVDAETDAETETETETETEESNMECSDDEADF